jgi:hypothetical protein
MRQLSKLKVKGCIIANKSMWHNQIVCCCLCWPRPVLQPDSARLLLLLQLLYARLPASCMHLLQQLILRSCKSCWVQALLQTHNTKQYSLHSLATPVLQTRSPMYQLIKDDFPARQVPDH